MPCDCGRILTNSACTTTCNRRPIKSKPTGCNPRAFFIEHNSPQTTAAVSLLQAIKTLPVLSSLHATYRRLQQERVIARTQARYERGAAAAGIRVLEGSELQNALRSRLADRPHPRWPKKKGQLHIFLDCPLYNWEFVLPLTLAPFGRVTEFDWRQRGFNDSARDWLKNRAAMNRAMLEAFHAANKEQPVDAIIGYLSGANTNPETLQEMANTGAAIFNFCFDDKLQFPGRKLGGRFTGPAAIAHVVDLNLSNAPISRIKYAMHGGLSLFFPQGAHPDFHKPYPVPFDFDASFVGARYGWRGPFIDNLQRLLAPGGIHIACFGKGWPGGFLSDEELTKLYSRSRINLGFGGVGYSQKVVCLKGRDFEVPMSGGLYLTQNNPELPLIYEVDNEILTYNNLEDCAQIIRETLADPARAEAIRKAGHARAVRDHSWGARWDTILKFAGLLAD